MNKINVTKPSLPPFEEYVAEISSIWENSWLTNFGPKERQLTEELKGYLDVPRLNLFVNGHQALKAAVSIICGNNEIKGGKGNKSGEAGKGGKGVAGGEVSEGFAEKPVNREDTGKGGAGGGVSEGGEIITTPFTFASTTQAIIECGLTPVFADIDPVTLTLSPEAAEKLITPKTRGILPVHVYGTMCDTEAFNALSKSYNIPVIYDAAHCFGVKKEGRGAGSFGTCSMFSFHATKAYNSVEGGGIATSDEELSEKLHEYANFGLNQEGDCELSGSNAKLNEFSAAMGLCNLRHIDEILEKRKKICEVYEAVIMRRAGDFDEATGLAGSVGLKMLPKQQNVTKNYAYFPLVIDENVTSVSASEAQKHLESKNVFTRRYFSPLTSDFTCCRKFDHGETPVADRVSRQVLALPLYADLSLSDAERIAELFLEAVRQK